MQIFSEKHDICKHINNDENGNNENFDTNNNNNDANNRNKKIDNIIIEIL